MSVRGRLLAILLGGLVVAWVAAAVALAVKADHEIEEVLDAQLAQKAAILALRADDDEEAIDTEHAPALHKYAKRLSFQVWKRGTRLVLHSADAGGERFSGEESGFSTVDSGGRRWRVFSLWDGERKYLVQVRDSLRDRDHLVLDILAALAWPLGVALPALALLVWVSVGSSLRPLARVGEEIARRDPAYLEPIAGEVPAEIGPLVARLNALLARVRSSLDGERRFTSDAAHELRTPLAALRAQLQVAQGAGDAASRDRAIANALLAGDRATRLVEQLLTLARVEQGAWKAAAAPFGLRQAAAEAISQRAGAAAAKRAVVSLEGEEPATVTGHEGLAVVAIGNLVDNAIRYGPEGGAVSVRIERSGAGYAVRVADEGPGIPASRREAALRRFTRLEGAAGEEGSGLGLSIVSRIAELHGGTLELRDGPGGRGLEAVLRLA